MVNRNDLAGKILMIIGIILLPLPMYFYTLAPLMSDWPPLAFGDYMVVLSGSLGGVLIILSVIVSFFKKTSKIGFIGSVLFSSFLIVAGINFFSGAYYIFSWLFFSLGPILIILGVMLRLFENRKILIVLYGVIFALPLLLALLLVYLLFQEFK